MKLFKQRKHELLDAFSTKMQNRSIVVSSLLKTPDIISQHFIDSILSLKSNDMINDIIDDFICLALMADPSDSMLSEQLAKTKDTLFRNSAESLTYSLDCIIALFDRLHLLTNRFTVMRPIKLLLTSYLEFNIDVSRLFENIARVLNFSIDRDSLKIYDMAIDIIGEHLEGLIKKIEGSFLTLVFYKLSRMLILMQLQSSTKYLETRIKNILTRLLRDAYQDCMKSGSELYLVLVYLSKNPEMKFLMESCDLQRLVSSQCSSFQIQMSLIMHNLSPQTESLLNFILQRGNKCSYLQQVRWLLSLENVTTNGQNAIVMVDLFRYLIVVAEDLPNNKIKRWLIAGSLLHGTRNENVRTLCKQALFWEWAYPGQLLDMPIKYFSVVVLGIELIVQLASMYLHLAQELYEFMLLFMEEHNCMDNLKHIMGFISQETPELYSAFVNSSIFGNHLVDRISNVLNVSDTVSKEKFLERVDEREQPLDPNEAGAHIKYDLPENEETTVYTVSNITYDLPATFKSLSPDKAKSQMIKAMQSVVEEYKADRFSPSDNLYYNAYDLYKDVVSQLTVNIAEYYHEDTREYIFDQKANTTLFSYILHEAGFNFRTNLKLYWHYEKFIRYCLNQDWKTFLEYVVLLFYNKDAAGLCSALKELFERVIETFEINRLNEYTSDLLKWAFCSLNDNEFLIFSIFIIENFDKYDGFSGYKRKLLGISTSEVKNRYFNHNAERLKALDTLLFDDYPGFLEMELSRLEFNNLVELVIENSLNAAIGQRESIIAKFVHHVNSHKTPFNHSYAIIKLFKVLLNSVDEVS